LLNPRVAIGPVRPHRPSLLPVLLGAAVLAAPWQAGGASKATIVAQGDGAPGGGVFSGPAFTSAAGAGGSGWIAFRGLVTDGKTSETMLVAHMTAPVVRGTVASIGQATPSSGIYAPCAGKIQQFLGPPAVNANGDVAFLALIEPPPSTDPNATATGPTPAGIFALRSGQLVPVACSGQPTAGGILDLTAVLDLNADPTEQFAERAPSINDAGDIAFLAGYVDANGLPTNDGPLGGGAVILAAHGGGYSEIARIGGLFAGQITFLTFGPPVLNNHGQIAFHGLASNDGGIVDGVYLFDGSTLQLLARDGFSPLPGQPVIEFEEPVAIDDAGDVAFLAGPLINLASSDATDFGSPAVFVASGGAVTLVSYDGQTLGPDRVSGTTLGPFGNEQLAGPSLAADGSVVFFASLDGGGGEVIVRCSHDHLAQCGGEDATGYLNPLYYTAGTGADTTPTGGLYKGTEYPPVTDAAGGVAFVARIAGGTSSEAVLYGARDGTTTPIQLGDAAGQSQGFFGGKAFSAPHLNDQGDVVFRAYVTRGSTSAGIYRRHGTTIEALVRAGDPAPLPGNPPFLDFVGEPSVNQSGAVAFAAFYAALCPRGDATDPSCFVALRRGIFVADTSGVHAVVLRGDPAPDVPGTVLAPGDSIAGGPTFATIGTDPAINDDGGVAYRGTTTTRDAITGQSIKSDGIFVSDAAGVHVIARNDKNYPSPAGAPFFKFDDPLLTDGSGTVFRAGLGTDSQELSGIFIDDTTPIAMEMQVLADASVLTGFTGNPAINPSGQTVFLATRSASVVPGGPPIRVLGSSILRSTAGNLEVLITNGQSGPLGGKFRSLAQPSINAAGHVLFRGSFDPTTGGTPGLFLHDDGGIEPYVLRGEVSPVGGTITAFGAQTSLNAQDEVAFTATVSGGTAQNVLVLASPAKLVPRLLTLHLTNGKARDRIRLRVVLHPGRLSDGIRPGKEPVTVSLSDTQGVLWSAAVPAKLLEGSGRSYHAIPKHRTDLGKKLRAVQFAVGKDDSVRFSAMSAAIDLTRGGLRTLSPPFTIGVEVGDDAARATIACTPGLHGAHCHL
jgi:hypothetical protein